MPRTPVFGIVANAVEQLRTDLSTHVKSCDAELATIRGDVKALIRETSAQTSTLEIIKTSIARRARTEEAAEVAEITVKTTKRQAWWKGLIGLALAGGGALLHYLVS